MTNKKTVGIITIHDIYNYGSILQAYATQVVIESLGYEAELIDYKYPNPYHEQKKNIKAYVFGKVNAILKDMLPGRLYSSYKKNYVDFKEKHYKLSKNSYFTVESLMDNPPIYDRYVCGSDQIWRTKFMKGDPVFFLDFTNDKHKIAYASSFGSVDIPNNYIGTFKAYLEDFKSISVRESFGVNIIEKLVSKKAEVVLDPTLMLDKTQWENLMAPNNNNNEPYILCYGLSLNDDYMERLALHIQKTTGWKIIRINGKFYDFFNKKINYVLDAGPAQWLSLFANASIILGQSFHATAFSVNFQIPFIPILRGNKDHDSRQKHFLILVNLEDRAITIGDEFPIVDESLLSVDFKESEDILNLERKKSKEFLIQSLK